MCQESDMLQRQFCLLRFDDFECKQQSVQFMLILAAIIWWQIQQWLYHEVQLQFTLSTAFND